MLERFKEHFKESIIDIPRVTYAKPVFDKADTDSPVLKPSVRKQLLDGIKQFEKFGEIVNHTLIGSILTKQYRDDADLDVTILFKIPGTKAEQEKVHEKIREFQWTANGKKVGLSNHIINYFSIIDPAVFNKNRKMADGTFDIDKNEFIRKPEPGTFSSEKYVADFQKRVSEIDVVKGELVRDMIDYEELKNLSADEVENLSTVVSKKLDEIKASINALIDMGDKIMQDRKDAFDSVMSPEQIRKFGAKNRLPKNVIYKMLEKYHYLKFYKTLVEIMEDGKITPEELKTLSKIKEARGRHIAFTFGRFNPPTIGHEKLLQKLLSVRADDHKIILSKSEDSNKNPLKLRDKVAAIKRMFPKYARHLAASKSNIIIDIVTEFYKKKYTELSMVVGSDRVSEFRTLLKKYNDVKSRHGYYNFDSINIVSAGERDPDAEGAMGMSASKMRAAVKANDFKTFKKGLPLTFGRSKDAEELFKQTRKGMHLAASYDPSLVEKKTKDLKAQIGMAGMLRFKPFITASTKEELNNMVLRDKYITEHLYDVGDIVDDVSNNVTGIIVRRGTNYVTLESTDGKLHKAWLYDIIETPVFSEDLEKKSKEIKQSKEKKHDQRDSIGDLPNGLPEKKEAYDMGHDWAKYTSSITPGEKHYNPKFQGQTYKPSTPEDNLINVNAEKNVDLKDIEEWVNSEDTIDKYKERYGEEWKVKLDEVYNKMFNKVVDTSDNMIEGRMKDIAIDLKHLSDDDFKKKYSKSKEELRKSLGGTSEVKSFKEFANAKV